VREDPLKFRDTKRYTDRLKAARAADPLARCNDRRVGKIDGHRAVVGVQDFGFMGGSMGMAAGRCLHRCTTRAIAEKCPYVVVTAAGGARMQEGILSLDADAERPRSPSPGSTRQACPISWC